ERSTAEAPSAIRGPVEAFANRLKKNIKNLGKWVKREQIHCYRLYDADIPEYAVAVDRYEQWLHVQEYVPPRSVDPAMAERRLLDILAVLPEVTGVPAEQIVLKRRERQSGKQQYEKHSNEKRTMAVREGQVNLLVNLRDYLDTGLFLDHRPVRKLLARLCTGKRFLNLFCYTASATVLAVQGGARESVNVDLSASYLDWARRNFELNGIDESRHRLLRTDCLKWLAGGGDREGGKFDVIFLDPPTFSNSKNMNETLDVQRDHERLISQAMALLAGDGVLVFSTNRRRFRLSENIATRFDVEDITARTIDRDFARRKNIHHCWLIRHRSAAGGA
ncbi:MAG TPA: bifunctional 23S rRNA (guanine(2069)-N(7))-methyltransferase RlmK/23S rRNA (guanine(2445)-N(2))-methyltransferase RlmL, partial [Porticoccaceae bacterium]|nr:bifunctional 23S rRNA (guanine(2069)-N(7))-methyltransferase RlmK/23S rRNA (guanine(2445)-N(2))-methyltransferase RlmL [Porticoccaceae bacterium]